MTRCKHASRADLRRPWDWPRVLRLGRNLRVLPYAKALEPDYTDTMKLFFLMVALIAAVSLPLPAIAGSVHFDYQGCGQPVSLTVVDTVPTEVWRQLASQVGFVVRVGTDAPDTSVDFSMSGPVIEVLDALARYTGAVLVAANDDACLGSRQVRTVWLMSEGSATATALMNVEENAPASVQPVSDPSPLDPRAGGTAGGAQQLNSPRRRGQMTAAEREAERERRRQARQARRDGRDDR